MAEALLALWVFSWPVSLYFIMKPNPEYALIRTRGKALTTALLLFIGLPILAVSQFPSNDSKTTTIGTSTASSTSQTVTNSKTVSQAAAAPHAAMAKASKWEYSEDTDQMRGTKTRYATLESENELSFGFPYSGGHATLTIRQRPSDGLNIVLRIKAQFLCSSYRDDTVAVKFDSGPIRRFPCSEPSDSSTGVLFIQNERGFLNQIKKAKTIIIEAQFFQEGRRQMTFDVRGLDWK